MASESDPIKHKHNKLLVDLRDLMDIDAPGYKNFITILRAVLPAGRLQSVKKEPLDVFHLMEERGILKVGDYSALEQALNASGNKQALDLVKNVGSEINIDIKGLGSIKSATTRTRAASDRSSKQKVKIATQGTSAATDVFPSNTKRKIATQGTSIMSGGSPSGKRKQIATQGTSIISGGSPSGKRKQIALTQGTSAGGDGPPSNKKRKIATQGTSTSSGGSPSAKNKDIAIQGSSTVGGGSQSKKKRKTVLQDEMEFLEAIRNDAQKVEQMIRSKRIPKRSIIERAVKQNGYSTNIQLALREMSNLLREIPESVGVWCGYKPNDPFTPVFVVTLENQKCILKKTEILKLFIDYSINIQYKHVPNDEERSITEKYGSKTIRSEDVARLNNCITTHTASLMTEHSNLSIIRPCPVKSRGYLFKQLHVIEDTCIVFYVPVKGIIPIGEKEFPTEIDGIATDVREGEFYFFGNHNAMEYHQKLRMGCGITGRLTGSLGGFVDLPGEKVGCLTAAHVVLEENQIQKYISLGEEEKRNLNNDLARGSEQIEIYQPTPEHGWQSFGRVHAIALDAGNIFSPSVDAAIIQITDDERKPETGSFPDGDFEDVGFTAEEPMFYTSGRILDDIDSSQRGCLVIKYGCTTGITRGYMEWIGESVRPVNTWGSYTFPVMMGQLEVKAYNFAAPGDSGALVFLCLGGNIRNLHAVGMVMGGTSTGCQCFITPIKAIFEKLGLINNRFKCFPQRELSQQEPTAQPLITQIGITEHLTMVEENMNRRMDERLMTIEQSIKENMNERFRTVEQNINDNMNLRFNRIEELLNRFSGNP